jgi:D-2-hydroxyacid dehydrogenase (NADP+)
MEHRRLRGAGLDVFTTEPLPQSSPLWNLDNVLLSPHNMDMTPTFMAEATEFFIKEQLPRFLKGEQLLNVMDKKEGY